jgi:hypothetical protein
MHLMKNSQLVKVASTAILCLQKYTNKESLERQAETHGVTQALRGLRLQDLAVNKEKVEPRGVGFRNILEKKGLRITIYLLPAGEIIKLHNHPAMLVVSYVVQGCLEAKLYSPTGSPGLYDKETSRLESESLSYIDGLRTTHKNLHEFRALEDTYFIDILFPDYDDKRDCTFFEEEEAVSELVFKLKPTDPGELAFFPI